MSTYAELTGDKRPRTLNSLQQQRYSLNRRLLLAIQTGDAGMQAELEQEILRNDKQIDEMSCAGGRVFR
ncbi:MAG: hypothetical protein HFH27_01440 [Clostridiaceae bacterium]|nr:hypothetical protein [Clostridiaceae bacterium]MCI9483110.1 hypothetical protein [Clostridiaceae bacterium]NBH78226.1 hypothetical protein [Clostridiaceae bacterium]NBI83500.1 hypothetical protein [Clostridiaceae bacterium]